MMAYASRTGTRRILDRLRQAGWGLMVSAKGIQQTEGFEHWCYDNGAWSAHMMGVVFDEAAFLKGYDKVGRGADFCVLPDIVAGGEASLDFSLLWRERLGKPLCLQLLAVQDGMSVAQIAPLVGPHLGIFVGGTAAWKETSLPKWSVLAQARGAHLHVGRVNSARRVTLCGLARVDSIDGTKVTQWGVKGLHLIDNAIRQGVLPCM